MCYWNSNIFFLQLNGSSYTSHLGGNFHGTSKFISTSENKLSVLHAASMRRWFLYFWRMVEKNIWNLVLFFKKNKCRCLFFSSQHNPCRMHWRTKGHHNVVDICAANCCRFHQPYVQLRSFYSATYGTIIIEFFIIIDLTCIILFAFTDLIQTDQD